MATRITFHQMLIAPHQTQTVENEDGTTEEAANTDLSSIVVPHVDSGWCQCVGTQFVGGGGEQRFLLNLIIFEPVPEKK